MAAGPGGATVERFIVGAQKSTNQLKGCAGRATSGCWTRRSRRSRIPWQRRGGPPVRHHGFAFSSARVSAAQRAGHAAIAMAEFYWCRRRRRPRSAPRRSGQRVRTDGACRMIVLQHGVQDSYTWRKYGQKEILGARFPRSYFRCGRKPGCPARKHVQQSDADPSKLELTYFAAHTCDDPPPPSSSPHIVPCPVRISGTADVLLPVAAVPAAPSSTQHDPVPDGTTFTPSMGAEQAELLFIPSPACSQSELLPAEIAKVERQGPPVWMEYGLEAEQDDEPVTISDFVVPFFLSNLVCESMTMSLPSLWCLRCTVRVV
ncbi:WRKY transcription factor WRKY71-like [Panicum virgatum]|uniref:WRKY domain-containing protein n=1 Tax=Panicum virgatum TaxID=38727 RepID=A0A8T0V9L9_PANVG|nr:WRKY transcription factor WRKY71-like [Panicum virgatum]KAG2633451.1 hypothetical protein PVAP13_2NG267503 [Panicum virgatum]